MPADLDRMTVLVVDDEDAVLRMVRTILEHSGFAVETACNGTDALMFVREHPGEVDLLLTDVVMPEMGGVELAAWVREAAPEIRILFMTGYTGTVAPEGPVLQKPFHPAELRSMVTQAAGEIRKPPTREHPAMQPQYRKPA